MKAINKLLLTGGSLTTIALPIVTVISCGLPFFNDPFDEEVSLLEQEHQKMTYSLDSTEGIEKFKEVLKDKTIGNNIDQSTLESLGVSFDSWNLLDSDTLSFSLRDDVNLWPKETREVMFKVILTVEGGDYISTNLWINLADKLAPAISINTTLSTHYGSKGITVVDANARKYALDLPSGGLNNNIFDIQRLFSAYDTYESRNITPTFKWKNADGSAEITDLSTFNLKKEGVYTLEVSAKDRSGNTSPTYELKITVAEDTTPPEILVRTYLEIEDKKVEKEGETNNYNISYFVTSHPETDKDARMIEEFKSLFYPCDEVDGHIEPTFSWKDDQAFKADQVADYVLIVKAKDATEHEAMVTLTIKVLPPPEAPIISVKEGPANNPLQIPSANNSEFEINSLTNAGYNVTFKNIHNIFKTSDNSAMQFKWTKDGVEHIVTNADNEVLEDGTYVLTVSSYNEYLRAKDFILTIKVDKTAPNTPTVKSADTTLEITNEAKTLSVDSTDNEKTIATLKADFESSLDPNATFIVKDQDGQELADNVKLGSLTSQTLTIWAKDAAGNLSEASFDLALTVNA